MYVQHRFYGTRRRNLHGVPRWNLQNHNRQCGMHTVLRRDILRNSRRDGGNHVCRMPFWIHFAQLEHIRHCLRLQRRVLFKTVSRYRLERWLWSLFDVLSGSE